MLVLRITWPRASLNADKALRMSTTKPPDDLPESGAHERRLAIGSVAQQGTQAISFAGALVTITVLGRRLPLPEFGTYALIVSFSNYLLFAQGSVESAAVRQFASAPDERAQGRVFTTAMTVYAAAGLIAAALLLIIGLALPEALGVPDALVDDARLGAALIAITTAIGWPLKTYRDALRAMQLFRRVAAADAAGFGVASAATVALAYAGAPLWLLIAVGGSVLPLIAVAALAIWLVSRIELRFGTGRPRREELREFTIVARDLLVGGAADLVIYQLDRVILGAFRSAATVGLYEGPVRAHNLVRFVTGALGFTVLPAASAYRAAGDVTRTHYLIVRGTRYVLALTLPLVAVLSALAAPLLKAWLGETFVEAAPAMTILLAYWLVAANATVAASVMIAHGHTLWLARYAWIVALTNLALSVALTAWLGLDGVVLGTTLPYLVAIPVFMRKALRELPVRASDLWAEAWLPGYTTAAAVGAAIVALRLVTPIEGLVPVIAVAAAGLGLAWGAWWVFWLRPEERGLAGDVVRGMFRTD
jgi:O-antigen/teichoic acid export membrane protein